MLKALLVFLCIQLLMNDNQTWQDILHKLLYVFLVQSMYKLLFNRILLMLETTFNPIFLQVVLPIFAKYDTFVIAKFYKELVAVVIVSASKPANCSK